MNNNFQKIKEIIQKSNIPISEREDLILLFAKANNEDLRPTLELFTKDSSWIYKINENYKAKQVALATGNSTLWQIILKEEESQLKELEQ